MLNFCYARIRNRASADRERCEPRESSHMPYSANDLRVAADAGVISAPDLERLLAFLARGEAGEQAGGAGPAARFDVANLLWYAGALIVIGAMGLFSTVAFSQMGGRALTICAIAYAIG